MNENEIAGIKKLVSKTPKSAWAQWPLVVCVFCLSALIPAHAVLLYLFKTRVDAELCVKIGRYWQPAVPQVSGSTLFERFILSASLLTIINVILIMLSILTQYKQRKLIEKMAREMKILD